MLEQEYIEPTEEKIVKSPKETELENLEYEYHKGSLVIAILENRIKIHELTERLNQVTTDQEEPKLRSVKKV